MPTVFIPPLLRSFTSGQESLQVEGTTVQEVIDRLETQFPGIKARLLDGGELRSGLAVAVDSQVGRLGLSHPVGPDSEVHFVLALSGG
jgi:hypothetical protein